ncbi:methyl-accepting chemotaxis protein [Bordetella sp. FB-8]|uniref:methyl-accepting chemotaxis protein n=1 Tax=Bordetella sp. FB-8 TaxID=1159870 RepID=UPI0003758E1A|nr:methyl-accepting chemotaxis protein [Bordetella sp. FB-8]
MTFLSRLSINSRIAVAMGFLGLLLICIGAIGLVGMTASNQANRQTYSVQMPKSIAVGEMTIFVGRQRTTLDRCAINPGSDDAKRMYGIETQVKAAADKAWKQYMAMPRDQGEDRLAAQVDKRYQETERELDRYQEATLKGDRDSILKLMVSVGTVYTQMQIAANALKTYQFDQAKAAYDATERTYKRSVFASVAAIIIGVLAALANWAALRRAIVGPVNEAIFHFSRIAAGDLSGHIRVQSRDEMGRMLQGLVDMQQSLTRIAVSLHDGSDAIATATREIASGNADLSARTESQAASLEQTAASTEQLLGTVKQTAENARHANTLSSSAADIARKGHDVMSRAVGTMGEISQSSSAISEITAMIESIAFQTNILSLNAAVEAARAGEQGRGFAVVASEVRALAQRSSTAAKEIKDLILKSTSRIEAGSSLVNEAGGTMNEIIEAVGRVNTIIAEIASAAQEQSRGLGQVSSAVNDMDQATQRNAALVEEAAAAAMSLQDEAQRLAQTATSFKLQASTQATAQQLGQAAPLRLAAA